MDTSIVKQKIRDFEAKSNNPFSEQIIREFKSWFVACENYISDLEQSNMELTVYMDRNNEWIELLTKLLVITGNANKITQLQVMDKHKAELVVNFLLKQKDRVNHENLYVIATLLELAKKEGKEITTVKRLVEYARTGN